MKRLEVISDQRSVISDTAPSTMAKADDRKLTTSHGFTLVEVVLAIAVISIGIIAILGLLPNALQSGRDAADNTLSATIAQTTFNNLRTPPFIGAYVCDFCPQPIINLQSSGSVTPINFDREGFETNAANAYYRVSLTYTNQAPLALSTVTATIVWPAKSTAPLNTNVFATEIAQYD